jgi:hypothetical protein
MKKRTFVSFIAFRTFLYHIEQKGDHSGRIERSQLQFEINLLPSVVNKL